MKIHKRTQWFADNFPIIYEAISDTLTVKETKDGFVLHYLVQDDMAESPSDCDDNNLFLAHYHRNCWIPNDIISKDDLRNWYQDEPIPQQEKYHIFPVSALIHSGVHLYLGKGTSPWDSGGWDTSHVGAILAAKSEWSNEKDAEKCAEGLVETWNQYLNGEVYGIIKETFDKDKKPIEEEAVWGNYGTDYALKALKEL